MQAGEGTHTPSTPNTPQANPARRKQDPEKQRIKVRITLYFDGTGNNRTNTDHREANDEIFRRVTKGDKFQESSYFNDYSNVARLDKYTRRVASGYEHYIKVYTEGIGTLNHEQDDTYGNTTGEGAKSGVRARVDKGLSNAISELHEQIVAPENYIIEKLTVDTSGFSRGATAARYCVHRILHQEFQFNGEPVKESLKRRLQGLGFEVEEVEVKAVGIFDTVSAMGIAYIDVSDVMILHLDAVREAKAVLHLAAAEEFRVCFSLTNIDSAVQAGVGHQVFLPGAHSDVGGGYRNGPGEDKVIWHGDGSWEMADYLTHYGWGNEKEVTVIEPWDRDARDHDVKKPLLQLHLRRIVHYVRLDRKPISNEYSYIPLHIMAKFFREQGVPLKAKLETALDPSALTELSKRLKAYAEAAIASDSSESSDWSYSMEPEIRELRRNHLHFSGKSELGFNLRTFKDFKQPTRRVYPDAK